MEDIKNFSKPVDGIYLQTEEHEGFILIRVFFLEDRNRNQGIGTSIIKKLQLYAQKKNKVIVGTPNKLGRFFADKGTSLKIDEVYSFYEKLGFRKSSADEEKRYMSKLIFVPDGYADR